MNLTYETLDTVHSFGGYEDALFDVYQRNWHIGYKSDVLQLLTSFPLPDFDSFEHNIDGTEKLHKKLTEFDNMTPAYMRFIFGCILYHQMLYYDEEDEFSAWYTEAEDNNDD